MLLRYVLPQTQTSRSDGTLSCKLEGTSRSTLATSNLNLAFDYHLADGRMRLVLSVMQTPEEGAATNTFVHGVEIAFEKDIASGRFSITNGMVRAAYWQLTVENNQTIFSAFHADSGMFELDFDEQKETYKGRFSFECFESAELNVRQVNVTQGVFEISGRDEFTL